MGTRHSLLSIGCMLLTACGGGGGSSGGGSNPPAAVDRVALTVTAPATDVGSGSTVPVEFLVSNPSASAATNVRLNSTLGSALSPGVMTCEAIGGATCPASGGTTVASLPANGSLRFRMNAMLASGATGAIISSASVTADNDGLTTNNLAQFVIHGFTADVRTSSTTNASDVMAGGVIAYSMTVGNTGPDAARDIALENNLSSGQQIVSITCAAAGGGTCPAQPGSTMNVASLPNGAALTFTVTTSLDQDAVGIVSDSLRATATAGDPLASNNLSTASSSVQMPVSRLTPSFVVLKSETGDTVGRGARYAFDPAGSTLQVTPDRNVVKLVVTGAQNWTGEFALPGWMTQLASGMYDNATRYPAALISANAMNLSIDGRECDALTGFFRVDDATYMSGELAVLDLRFEQRCENSDAPLRGQIHWVSARLPPGPVNPPPSLWTPPPGATPATGNYVYLQGDPGDYIVGPTNYLYTQMNSVLTLKVTDNYLQVFVNGNQHWNGDFRGMASIEKLVPGYYGNLGRYPFGNPLAASLAWSGEGRGCNDLTGWFVVDGVTYSGSSLASIDLRFEQHCEGVGPALRGKVHWTNGDTSQPAGPQVPPPAGLWQPAPGETPATGNYLYLSGDPGDFILDDATILYTQADTKFLLDSFGAQFHLRAISYEFWQGDFIGMNTLQQLQVGYYGNISGAGSPNPAYGAMDWYGEGRGCKFVTGWFVIDSIAYTDGAISAIDLRFEQHCDGYAPALHGKFHWTPRDPTKPPGPVNPPPDGLWQPAPGTTPASGNYVYLQSDPGDYVGAGQDYTLTLADSLMEWRVYGNYLRFFVYGDTTWSLDFQTMDFLTEVKPGFYPNLLRWASRNPVVGGFNWSGEGRGCNLSYGWVVVDAISFSNGAVDAIDMRFEQHCEYGQPALHGKIHWRADDPTQAPGPVTPPPANLWIPAQALPTSGNYVYLESRPGDFIGQGLVETYTPSTNPIEITTSGARLNVRISGSRTWMGHFTGMSFLTQLQPGYYGGLLRNPTVNPVKGELDWSGEGRGCNLNAGWFVIDDISYQAGELKSVDLRFEQVCEQTDPPLRGKIHWVAP